MRRVLGVRGAPQHRPGEPPGGQLPHGSAQRPGRRRQPRAQGARRGQAARGRRVRHAGRHVRQHARARRHDRREGIRHDQEPVGRPQSVEQVVSRARITHNIARTIV